MGQLGNKHFAVATIIAIIFIAAMLRGVGIALIALTGLFTWAIKTYFHRRLGGITGDIFGAVSELTETFALVFLALGAR
jgi:adenosylcobinamide-GDP ribazoletransferase